MSQTKETLSAFIRDSPPGEVGQVKEDIAVIVEGNNQLIANLDEDVADHNVEQFATADLGSGTKTVVSRYNQLSTNEFADAVSGKKFTFDHESGKASVVGECDIDSEAQNIAKSVGSYVDEHYPSNAAFGVFPIENGEYAIVLVDSKYSPHNYWNGRWRAEYKYSPSTNKLTGNITVDVHYFEDGNVRLKSTKKINPTSTTGTPAHAISKLETEYQTALNRAFLGLNDGVFKHLRRQLPVSRGKMNWSRPVSGYQISHGIQA